jgi:hypothetical protein
MEQTNGQTITLNFSGPFTFTKGGNSLFHTAFVNSKGIYIWTIKDETNGVNYFHYIGETTSFGERHREHLIQITGLNYRIINPDFARQGIEKIVWNGMWRDKSPDAVATLLGKYDEVNKRVVEYVSLINIYFAPTACQTKLRRHIEGCIARGLRKKYPDLRRFYPDDNHVGTYPEPLGQKLMLSLPEPIAGLDREQFI